MNFSVIDDEVDFEKMRKKLLAKCDAAGDRLKQLLKNDEKEMSNVVQAVDELCASYKSYFKYCDSDPC